jgi:hypothetical protein
MKLNQNQFWPDLRAGTMGDWLNHENSGGEGNYFRQGPVVSLSTTITSKLLEQPPCLVLEMAQNHRQSSLHRRNPTY